MDSKYLEKAYSDPRQPGAFQGVHTFSKARKNKNFRDVKEVLEGLDTYTKFVPTRKIYQRPRLIAGYPKHILSVDLADYQKFKGSNRNFAYILLIVDNFTKLIYARGLKSKSAEHVAEAFKDIFKKLKPIGSRIHADYGKEFWNSKVKAVMEEFKCTLYKTFSPLKAFTAEIYIRRLKRILEKLFYVTKRKNWIDHLKDIIENLNNTYNRSIKMKPNDASKHPGEVFQNLYGDIIGKKPKPSKLKEGDKVRISVDRLQIASAFRKGYQQTFSDEIFIVDKVVYTPPVYSYLLKTLSGEDVPGKFLQPQLTKTK
jgi:hypothetical protein